MQLTDIMVFQSNEEKSYCVCYNAINNTGQIKTKLFTVKDIAQVIELNKISHYLVHWEDWQGRPFIHGIGYHIISPYNDSSYQKRKKKIVTE